MWEKRGESTEAKFKVKKRKRGELGQKKGHDKETKERKKRERASENRRALGLKTKQWAGEMAEVKGTCWARLTTRVQSLEPTVEGESTPGSCPLISTYMP